MHSRSRGRLAWDEARDLARRLPAAMPSTETALDDALGSALAAPLRALVPVPSFDTSAMDGYAVAGAGPWTVTGSALAGETPSADPLGEGLCVEIATGAPVPSGTRAVLAYEEASRDGDAVSGTARDGRHVRRRGEGCEVDELLLPRGHVVTPAVLGLAASVGHDRLTVVRRPRVAVLVTGDEVVDHGTPGPGRVRDAIGPVLPGTVDAAGGVLAERRHLRDDPEVLGEALRAPGRDVLVVCGASSAGPADHLRPVLVEIGAELLVDGVACRPGHPQVLARTPEGRWVVGLPGNPYAALVAAATLLVPLLTTCAGRGLPAPDLGRFGSDPYPHPRDTRIVAVRREGPVVEAVGHDRPAVLWGAALADALAVVPPGWSRQPVELVPLPGVPLAAGLAGCRPTSSGADMRSVGV